MRRRISTLLLACAALPAGMIAGCGGGGGGGNVDVGPAAAVPADTPIYLDATVKPTGSAEADAKAALSKVLDTNDPGGKIIDLLQKQAKADGHPINFQQDVSPWLGDQVGVFFSTLSSDNSNATAIAETTDPAAALAFAHKSTGTTDTNPAPQSYNGASYQADPTDPGNVFGTVGNFLVEGDEAGFKAAVDAQKGDSLGDSDDFKDALGDLPDDRLGTFYTVPKNLVSSLGPNEVDPTSRALLEKSAGDALEKPVSGALTASADSFDLDFVGGNTGTDTPESSLIGEVPAQSWLALGVADLGGIVNQTLDQVKDQIPNFDAVKGQIESTTGSSLDDLTGALGDAALYVQGTKESTLSGALVVQTKDPDLTGRLLDQLKGLLQIGTSGGVKPLQLSGGGTGFQISDPSIPAPVEIAQQGDKLVIGYGGGSAEQTLAPTQTLGDSPTFSSAKGQVSDLGTDFFLDFPSVFKLAEATGAKSDPDYRSAKPYIDALSYLISGSGSKGDQTEVKAVLGLK